MKIDCKVSRLNIYREPQAICKKHENKISEYLDQVLRESAKTGRVSYNKLNLGSN